MDNLSFTTDPTGEATPLEGANGAGQPNAEQTPPPQYLSVEDFERRTAESDARWQARLEEVERRAQAKADKARDAAIRKANVFASETTETMKRAGIELDAEQVEAVRRQYINDEFWTEKPQVETPTAAPSQIQSEYVSRAELVAYLETQGLTPDAVDLAKYENRRRGDASADQDLLDDIALAKARQVETRRKARQQQQAAQQVSQVQSEFGSVGNPSAGAPSAGYNPLVELDKMNAQEPPDNPVLRREWQERYTKLMNEAAAKGWQ